MVLSDIDSSDRAVGPNVDPHSECSLVQGVNNGVHAANRGKRAHPEFKVGDHMQHGWSPIGVAAVVRGVAVEQLLEVRVAGPPVPIVEFAGQGQGAPGPECLAEVTQRAPGCPARTLV